MAADRSPEERRARLAYLESVRELNRAMNAWDLVSLDVDPESPNVAASWTGEQLSATQAVARAWPTLVARRQEYDAIRRRAATWR